MMLTPKKYLPKRYQARNQIDTEKRGLSLMQRTQRRSQSVSCRLLTILFSTIEIFMMLVHTICLQHIALLLLQARQFFAQPTLRSLNTRRRAPITLLNSKYHCMKILECIQLKLAKLGAVARRRSIEERTSR